MHVAQLATEFRQEFKQDVVIDIFCYRRHGHNEGDEPGFTQPIMYRPIAQHPTTRQIYAQRLVAEGVLSEEAGAKPVRRLPATSWRRPTRPRPATSRTRSTGWRAPGPA